MKSRTYTQKFSTFFFGTLVVLFVWAVSIAQAPDTLSPDEVSEEDLQKFLNINMRMLKLQEEAMQEVEQYIQELGMTAQRYAQIAAAENNPQQQSNATEEEIETAKQISSRVQQINMQLEQQAEQVIEEEGFTMEQYQAVGAAIESSPDLQTRINELMQKEIQ